MLKFSMQEGWRCDLTRLNFLMPKTSSRLQSADDDGFNSNLALQQKYSWRYALACRYRERSRERDRERDRDA